MFDYFHFYFQRLPLKTFAYSVQYSWKWKKIYFWLLFENLIPCILHQSQNSMNTILCTRVVYAKFWSIGFTKWKRKKFSLAEITLYVYMHLVLCTQFCTYRILTTMTDVSSTSMFWDRYSSSRRIIMQQKLSCSGENSILFLNFYYWTWKISIRSEHSSWIYAL